MLTDREVLSTINMLLLLSNLFKRTSMKDSINSTVRHLDITKAHNT